MAPGDNLPHFRRWVEDNIGRFPRSINDMQVLGNFIRYHLDEASGSNVTTIKLKYRGRYWKLTLATSQADDVLLKDEIVAELTDEAISSVIAQCAFNEGSVLNERKRQGQTNSQRKEDRR